MITWTSIPIDRNQLILSTVLRCGQSFRWRNIDGVWSICLKRRVILLKQEEANIYFASIGDSDASQEDTKKKLTSTEEIVKDYLNLRVDVADLYQDWQRRDPRFAKSKLQGVRILRQDPWETLCAFICSSNNNIKRISKMVNSLCTEFGPFVASHDGQDYHDFPEPLALAGKNVEQRLRDLGFGYRAKYIVQTAKAVSEMPDGLAFLTSLRAIPFEEAHEHLLQFSGVGPKVADCVCLMSLDKHSVVPVDTHIYKIASRDYKIRVKGTSAKDYKYVQNEFHRIWGDYAGWAHSVLFAADLSSLDNGINITEASKVKQEESPEPAVKRRRLSVRERLAIKNELHATDSSTIAQVVKVESS